MSNDCLFQHTMFECPYCSTVVDLTTLIEHVNGNYRLSKTDETKCKICCRKMTNFQVLKSHIFNPHFNIKSTKNVNTAVEACQESDIAYDKAVREFKKKVTKKMLLKICLILKFVVINVFCWWSSNYQSYKLGSIGFKRI